jgi:hypothetical protein
LLRANLANGATARFERPPGNLHRFSKVLILRLQFGKAAFVRLLHRLTAVRFGIRVIEAYRAVDYRINHFLAKLKDSARYFYACLLHLKFVPNGRLITTPALAGFSKPLRAQHGLLPFREVAPLKVGIGYERLLIFTVRGVWTRARYYRTLPQRVRHTMLGKATGMATEGIMRKLLAALRAWLTAFRRAPETCPAPAGNRHQGGGRKPIPSSAGADDWDDVVGMWIERIERNYSHHLYPGITAAAREPAMRRELVRALVLTHRDYPVVWFAVPAIALWVREGVTAEAVVARRRRDHEAKAERKAARAARKAAKAAGPAKNAA